MLLEIEDLCVEFDTPAGVAKAIDGVHFSIDRGKTHSLVGESGCGKSVSALALIGLLSRNARITRGRIVFNGEDLTRYTRKQFHSIRGAKIGMIFQEPMTSLNPVMRVGDQILEAVRLHPERALVKTKDPVKHVIELIDSTGIRDPQQVYRKYPHELSGGMRQRIMIAIALACRPELLIADEPTTALDVTTQAQILALLNDLQSQTGTAILLITHNLGVVAQSSHTMSVMYAGQVVEEGSVKDVFEEPCHPYTKALFAALPDLTTEQYKPLKAIAGSVPPATEYDLLGSPCRFFDRCEFQDDRCFQQSNRSGHRSYCRRKGN